MCNNDKNFIDKIAWQFSLLTETSSSIEQPQLFGYSLGNTYAKDNHQFENANFYLKNNACWI